MKKTYTCSMPGCTWTQSVGKDEPGIFSALKRAFSDRVISSIDELSSEQQELVFKHYKTEHKSKMMIRRIDSLFSQLTTALSKVESLESRLTQERNDYGANRVDH